MSAPATPIQGSTPKPKKTTATKEKERLKAQFHKYSYSSVGGLTSQVKQLQELTTLLHDVPRKVAKQLGIEAKLPRGVLLYGPPGSGKTLLAKAVISEARIAFSVISTLEALTSQTSVQPSAGDVEPHLVRVFTQAKANAPHIIFIDDLETICPKYDSTGQLSFQESKAVGTLVNLIDSLSDTEAAVLIIATCSRPDAVHHSLRRTGRFDKEIEISVPITSERREILHVAMNNVKHSLTEEHVASISDRLHGFVGADINTLCSEACLAALRRATEDRENIKDSEMTVSYDDFLKSLPLVKPSALREVQIEVQPVRWQDIGGQDVTKFKFRQSVEWPLKYAEKFQLLGIRPPRGILLFGPPGCSKTLMARALATEGGINFLAIKGPELYNKYVGESERSLREIFNRARKSAPSIIFIDEIDALSSQRGGAKSGNSVGDRILATLLNEMDGIECLQEVIVVGATNRPEVIDKALMRPGRLDRIIYVPLPDSKTRREILNIRFRKTPTASDVDTDGLVERTEGFSGAEITALCQEAALAALEEDLDTVQVSMRHFEKALSSVKPRTTPDTTRCYNEFYQKNALDSSG